ncbi:MAG: glycoside hydrolase [Ruminococcus sp.]|nr:glycoside hydrolase [Ruminococcus sp.]
MKINKIISFVSSAVLALSSLTACQSSEKIKVKPETSSSSSSPDSPSISDTSPENSEIITYTSGGTTAEPAETYPDYPISYPEIEKKHAGDLYEAEEAWMTENLEVKGSPMVIDPDDSENSTVEKYSGYGYVTGFGNDGNSFVIFEVDAPTNQHYDLSFSISSDKLVDCRISLNDKEISTFKTMDDDDFTLITLYGVFLTKGKSRIEICPQNGNIKLDYMKIANNTSLSEIKYTADGRPSNKNAGESAKELLAFLSSNYGKYTVTGQYASDETNSEIELVYQTTGKYPAIRFSAMHTSGNSFDSTFKDIDACADWYRKGGIVGLMWYWEAPSKKPSVYAKETDFRLSSAVTDEKIAELSQEEIRGLYGEGKISEQCYGLILDIDNMAGQLMSLKNKGIPVLWRPLHEAYGDWFWWGADGTDAYQWLWELMYNRFTKYFELDNLIWIWNGQSESTLVNKSTFDIASLDIYMNPEKDFGSRYEQFLALQNIVGKNKLIALSECSRIPDIDISFRDNAVWSFFGLWYGKYLTDENGEFSEEYISKEDFIRSYNSDGALTLDEYITLCGGNELVPQYDESVTTTLTTTSVDVADTENTTETTAVDEFTENYGDEYTDDYYNDDYQEQQVIW